MIMPPAPLMDQADVADHQFAMDFCSHFRVTASHGGTQAPRCSYHGLGAQQAPMAAFLSSAPEAP